MPPPSDILAWSLIALATLTTLYTLAMAARMALALRNSPRLLDPDTSDSPAAREQSVCVICAARNEEHTIAGFAHAFLDQTHRNLRLLVVLDRCTDDTETALRRAVPDETRLEILHNDSCPPGFNGKANAIHEATRRAAAVQAADLILLTDADARPDPRCLTTAIATLEALDADALSLFAAMPARRWHDAILQPVLFLEFARRHPLDRLNDDTDPLILTNGPFTLVRRTAYLDAGGHAPALRSMLEDAALGHSLRDAGKRVRVLPSCGLLRIDRDLTFQEFRRRWIRNLTGPHALLRALRLLIMGALMPLACLAALVLALLRLATDTPGAPALLFAGLASLLVIGTTLYAAYRIQGRPAWAVLLYPLASLIAAHILLDAARAARSGRVPGWARDTLQETPA